MKITDWACTSLCPWAVFILEARESDGCMDGKLLFLGFFCKSEQREVNKKDVRGMDGA